MNSDVKILVEALDDGRLVELGVKGDREAFGQLVARYQSPVCAMAYSACGNITQSEDLAQETFIVAWRKLGDLKEPGKFKAWLFGIARNLINNAFRRQVRNPLAAAEILDEGMATPVTVSNPAGQAISKEEEEILWRSIENIPETYREPLVLFYREHQSIESVAATLEISEEAARQRLSRGRKLLQEQVIAFVEGALARTNPGQAFTLSVLAALPITFAASAKAATVAAAAKGGVAVVKGATLVSLFSIWLGPALGVLLGYMGYRENRKNAYTPRERTLRNSFIKIMCIGGLVFCVSFVVLVAVPRPFLHWDRHPMIITMLGLGMTIAWGAFASMAAWRYTRAAAKLREEERQLHPELFRNKPIASTWPVVGEVLEYRSRATLLGLPLVHCRFGSLPGQKTKPAVGWIAYGERAYGILFASGGLAVGTISAGGASFGILAIGGLGIGLIGFGGFAIGAIAFGGGAIGLVASGGVALGWHAALGGMAVAHEFALGGGALANHVNDAAAQEFFTHYHWLNILEPGPSCLFWVFAFGPGFLQIFAWRWFRKKMASRVMEAGKTVNTI